MTEVFPVVEGGKLVVSALQKQFVDLEFMTYVDSNQVVAVTVVGQRV